VMAIYWDKKTTFVRCLMDPRQLFADERHGAFCVFCGAEPTTREHVASRVLLDDPLPDDLPTVRSCHDCNSNFSRHEEYLACLIDCVISGSTDPARVGRQKTKAILRHSPALAARIADGRTNDAVATILWRPEEDRVRKVVLKLARAHAAHHYSEPWLDEPEHIIAAPMMLLSAGQRKTFENIPEPQSWPEIGSRAFISMAVVANEVCATESGWTVLQSGRYRFAISQAGRTVVRIVLSEFLACEVAW
jgi:hypothetical protein